MAERGFTQDHRVDLDPILAVQQRQRQRPGLAGDDDRADDIGAAVAVEPGIDHLDAFQPPVRADLQLVVHAFGDPDGVAGEVAERRFDAGHGQDFLDKLRRHFAGSLKMAQEIGGNFHFTAKAGGDGVPDILNCPPPHGGQIRQRQVDFVAVLDQIQVLRLDGVPKAVNAVVLADHIGQDRRRLGNGNGKDRNPFLRQFDGAGPVPGLESLLGQPQDLSRPGVIIVEGIENDPGQRFRLFRCAFRSQEIGERRG